MRTPSHETGVGTPKSAADAFEDYYRANWLAVLRFTQRRIGDVESARDVCQECFALAWQEFDPTQPRPLTWLYNLAWNEVKRSYRHQLKARALLERLVAEAKPEGADPAMQMVVSVLSRLDQKHREVLELRYWDELGAAEIAVVLDVEPATVWQRLSRARAAVRILLVDRAKRDGAQ